jgi:hypothetical protein
MSLRSAPVCIVAVEDATALRPMNCKNSSRDTTPFMSLSIMRTSVLTSLSAVASVRLLTARPQSTLC